MKLKFKFDEDTIKYVKSNKDRPDLCIERLTDDLNLPYKNYMNYFLERLYEHGRRHNSPPKYSEYKDLYRLEALAETITSMEEEFYHKIDTSFLDEL